MPRIKYLTVFMAIILTSCMTNESTVRRGKLSDAVKKASYSDAKKRVITNKIAVESDNYEETTVEEEQNDMSENTNVSDFDVSAYFGFSSFYVPHGLISGDYYEMFDDALSMQFIVSKNSVIGLAGGYQFRNINYESPTYNSIHSTSVLYFSAQIDYWPWPIIRYMSPFVFAGGGGRIMFWDYTHPIKSVVMDTNGNVISEDMISSDSLGGVMLFAGTGVSIFNTDAFRWNVNIRADFNVNGLTTHEGFDNDYFGVDADIALGTELLFHF